MALDRATNDDVQAALRVILQDRTRTELVTLLANAVAEQSSVNPALVQERLRDILTGRDMPGERHKQECCPAVGRGRGWNLLPL